MYEDSIRQEFTHQSQTFGTSAAMTSAETLGALIDLVPGNAQGDWIDVACGPGVVSRALAERVGSVKGVDPTPAMVEEAARRAGQEGVGNVDFARGDATALEFPCAIPRTGRARRPSAERFRVTEGPDGRHLHQHYWLGCWQRPR